MTKVRKSTLYKVAASLFVALFAGPGVRVSTGAEPLKSGTGGENLPVVQLGQEWRSLLDDELTDWELWMGVPHVSVGGLPPGTPTSQDVHTGTPLGLNNDPKKVFSVVHESGENILHITGEIFGGLTTRQSFTNYHLQLQVRWGTLKWEPKLKVPRDSGVLIHCHGPHGAFWKVWMQCLECQVQEHDMGDLFLLAGTGADVRDTSGTYDPKGEIKREDGRVKHLPGEFEKPNGEWNTLDIYTVGQNAVFMVNGHVVQALQNAVTKATPNHPESPLTSGQIQIQCEGAEVEYRRIKIQSISTLPPEKS